MTTSKIVQGPDRFNFETEFQTEKIMIEEMQRANFVRSSRCLQSSKGKMHHTISCNSRKFSFLAIPTGRSRFEGFAALVRKMTKRARMKRFSSYTKAGINHAQQQVNTPKHVEMVLLIAKHATRSKQI